MEFLIGAILAIAAWLLWNGMRPPGATVASSLERDRRRRERSSGQALKAVLAGIPALTVTLGDLEAFAAPLGF
jgi:hypothetical protein